MAGVGMDGHEQIRLLLIGDCSPRLKGNESVVTARVNHVGAEASLQQLAQPPADFQHQILFFEAMQPDGARVMPTVTGIDYDLADFQSQGADQRAVAARGWLSFADIRLGEGFALVAVSGFRVHWRGSDMIRRGCIRSRCPSRIPPGIRQDCWDWRRSDCALAS